MSVSRMVPPRQHRRRLDREHARLLHTFRDFALEEALADLDADPMWDLRGAAAYLGDQLATLAVQEEQELGLATAAGEAAALEHAALRAELAAFLHEIGSVRTASHGRPGTRERLLQRVRRLESLLVAHADGVRGRADCTTPA
ncbi:MAG: hypothetical protein AMXMBFR53_09240 [Gemmatimonadota bacterium]